MKIAISGAVCTGKTTLGEALAEQLGLRFIAENLKPLFSQVWREGRERQDRADALFARLAAKQTLENQAGDFVVDRSPLDLMNFWMAWRLPEVSGERNFHALAAPLAGYDFVILTPFEGIPFAPTPDDDDGPKRTSPWFRFNGAIRIVGLAEHFLDVDRIIRIPTNAAAHEDRLAYVLGEIDARRRG